MRYSDRPSLRSLTLRALGPDRFISDDRARISICDLQTGSSIVDLKRAYRQSVLIRTRRQLPTVLALIELDGIASRVVLCPPDQWQHMHSIMATASTTRIVSDEPLDDSIQVGGARYGPACERDAETEWVLLTSGTTGQPKMAIHTLSSLTGPLDDGLIVSSGAVWSTFYDVRRYGGLQILLRALLGGGSLILSSTDETPTDFLTRLGRCGVTHISGTPSHWRRALMSPAANAIVPRYVRLSGEIADQAILDRLNRVYCGSSVAHAYASTEAGVGFDVRDGKAGFPASLIGDPNLKAELRIVDGTLCIRSTRTASGYIGKPLAGFDGFVDTGDLVEKHGDRYYFAGRKEGVINVGGQKVYPEEVEAVIAQHPDVHIARVWGRSNPITGSLVAADIVLRAHSSATITDIRAQVITLCRRQLAAWKVPVSIRQVNSIPLNPVGKIARHAP